MREWSHYPDSLIDPGRAIDPGRRFFLGESSRVRAFGQNDASPKREARVSVLRLRLACSPLLRASGSSPLPRFMPPRSFAIMRELLPTVLWLGEWRLMKIVQFPHPSLRHPARPLTAIDKKVQEAAAKMIELMYERLPKDRFVPASPLDSARRGPYGCFAARTPEKTAEHYQHLRRENVVVSLREGWARRWNSPGPFSNGSGF